MAIQPVESASLPDIREIGTENRPADTGAFARMLGACAAKKKTVGNGPEKVAETAELLRLEMMKCAVSLAGNGPEPAAAYGSDAVQAFLTQYSDMSQKTDTAGSILPGADETDEVNLDQQATVTFGAEPVTGGAATPYDAIIRNAANRYGVQEGLIKAVIKMESGFNPRAVSHAGARGLMQLMPATAAGLGVRDSFDPEQNIMAGTRFLRDLLEKYGGDMDSALAAYNWGPGNVDRNHGAFLPRETREYLVKVKKYYSQFIA